MGSFSKPPTRFNFNQCRSPFNFHPQNLLSFPSSLIYIYPATVKLISRMPTNWPTNSLSRCHCYPGTPGVHTHSFQKYISKMFESVRPYLPVLVSFLCCSASGLMFTRGRETRTEGRGRGTISTKNSGRLWRRIELGERKRDGQAEEGQKHSEQVIRSRTLVPTFTPEGG